MLSHEDLAGFADAPPRLVPPRFPLTADQSSALNAVLRAIDRVCCESDAPNAEQARGASLTKQLAAAEARRAALAPAIEGAMATQEELVAAGLELSVQGAERFRHRLVVSRRRSMAPRGALERDAAE